MLNGRIAGVWEYVDKDSPLIKLFLFAAASERDSRSLNKEALRLGVFLGGGKPELVYCGNMTPLAERTAGGFMAPLKDV